jgi:hypothetical protein
VACGVECASGLVNKAVSAVKQIIIEPMKHREDKTDKKTKSRYVFTRLILIMMILFGGGLIYGFAGPEREWGTIQIVGVILCAFFFPWEWLFIDKIRKKSKTKRQD